MIGLKQSNAQSTGKVVFENYAGQNADFLQALKYEDKISGFTSMAKLKQDADNLKENKLVSIKYTKGTTKTMNPSEMIRERKASVPFICIYNPGQNEPEKVFTFATAIVLSADGICATNYHVLSGLIERSVKLNASDSIMFVAISTGQVYAIQSILSYNKAADLALFQLNTRGDKLKPIPIGQDLPQGATVHTLTHPDGYPFFYSRGIVHRNVSVRVNDPFTNRMEMSADYAVGSSGGPIMDDQGNLVAMVSSTRSIYAIPNQQRDLQMVVKSTIPISSMLKLIRLETR